MQPSNCKVCPIVSLVGFDACDAIALMGHSSVLSTARPKNRKLPHTCWMNFLPYLSNMRLIVEWHFAFLHHI